MMSEMSRATRRFLAVGLLLLLLLLGYRFLLGPSIEWMNANIAALDNSRYQINRLERIASKPPLPAGPKLSPGTLIVAKDREAAEKIAVHYIQTLARKNGLSNIQKFPLGEQALPSVVALEINVTGPETNIIEFITELENDTPLMKFHEWKLSAPEDQIASGLNLAATVKVVWTAR